MSALIVSLLAVSLVLQVIVLRQARANARSIVVIWRALQDEKCGQGRGDIISRLEEFQDMKFSPMRATDRRKKERKA